MDRDLDLCYERRRCENRRCTHQSVKTRVTFHWGHRTLLRMYALDADQYPFHSAHHAGAGEIPHALSRGIHLGGHTGDAGWHSQKEALAQ